ncbi:MAG: peptide chain release factor N(5)-glutamine methyltransferase [Verrucomicrobia bacterium]|nr:peptide chain release factor N(5)-glutamine methyltransferase [Verrucomicrobiota bacterium]
MKTIGELLQLSAGFLEQKGIPRPRREAEDLLSAVLSVPRLDLYMQLDRPLVEEEISRYRSFIQKRAQGTPYEYIVGKVKFLDAELSITPDVLIPRPETEILVAKILEQIPGEPLEVWDVCTGSGCIAIALKKARPQWSVFASDISPIALAVAKANAVQNGVDVTFFEGDLLQPFQGRKADVIISNPPYVTLQEYASMDKSEPKIALVGGTTGYEFYQRFAQEISTYLKPGGKVYFEIGTGMGEKVASLFSFGKKKVESDFAGHDRFVVIQ